MNRLSPLIDRRPPYAAALTRPAPARLVLSEESPGWLRDAKLFGLSYLAGVVVFGTLIA